MACAECHKGQGEAQRFHFEARACVTCHQDPHQTKLVCETCHTPQQWKPAAAFDHAGTGFRLEGGHAKPGCAQCHRPVDKAPVFANTPKNCAACHAAQDAHGGQFQHGTPPEDCAACHVAEKWSANIFNHDRARYPLDVAHRRVDCEKCHKGQTQVGAKLVRAYRGTPLECIKCH